jgi:hypothetical protein
MSRTNATAIAAPAANRRRTSADNRASVGSIGAAFGRLGYDVDRLLSEVGVRRSDIDEPDAAFPCEVCRAFFARALQERPLKKVSALDR